jgi:phospholipase/carboxylesterase
MVPLMPEVLPELKGAPVLVAAGNFDPIVSVDNARDLVTLLRRAGADVTAFFENASHGLTETTVLTAKRWLQDWGRI